MSDKKRSRAVQTVASPRFLPRSCCLFVGSGCAALIYEIVWFQLLQLVIGSSAVSLGVLLGHVHGRHVPGQPAAAAVRPARRHPLRVYALLELGIGVMRPAGARSSLPLRRRPLRRQRRARVRRHPASRGLLCGICLLPPTLLMGATLPGDRAWVETTPQGVSWLGFFYGGNIAGAVFGCLLAGFYLLRVYDMATATSSRWRSTSRWRRSRCSLSQRAHAYDAAQASPARAIALAVARGAWPSMSPSRSPGCARSAPKWCGRACCR